MKRLCSILFLSCLLLITGCSGKATSNSPFEDFALTMSREDVRAKLGEPGRAVEANISDVPIDQYDGVEFLGYKGNLFFGYNKDLMSCRYLYWACQFDKDISKLDREYNAFMKHFKKVFGEPTKKTKQDGTLDTAELPQILPKDRVFTSYEWKDAKNNRVILITVVSNRGTTFTLTYMQ